MNIQTKKIIISTGKQYFFSTVILFFFIAILYCVQENIGYQTVSLILLLIIFILPFFNFDKGPIILSAVISAFAWDYYFIPPRFTIHIDRTEDVMMLFMFFVVALTNGILTSRLKLQKNEMIGKERRSNALYNLLKILADGKDLNEVVTQSVQQILTVFGSESVIFFSADQNRLKRDAHPASNFFPDEMEWLAAETAYKNKTETGKTTNVLQSADAKYFPLTSKDSVFCVIGVKINDKRNPDSAEMEFLKSFIMEISHFFNKCIKT